MLVPVRPGGDARWTTAQQVADTYAESFAAQPRPNDAVARISGGRNPPLTWWFSVGGRGFGPLTLPRQGSQAFFGASVARRRTLLNCS
jgi:hypothetical protein